ncbi:LysR substrate-binding domain-containing protein [Streptomyces sp. DSM 41987]|uniref:LysR substrate-binding domain-containing protein n=1 Tax=Streptomyces TaxID=1883 RepID=UPI0018DF6C5B|nr:LysR substrate-binding domain-containing protein [Streptomyces fildesensis]
MRTLLPAVGGKRGLGAEAATCPGAEALGGLRQVLVREFGELREEPSTALATGSSAASVARRTSLAASATEKCASRANAALEGQTGAPLFDRLPRIGFVAAEWIAKQGFVAAGLGVTLVPALAAASVRADIALVALHPDDVPGRAVHAATARGLSPSPAVGVFLGLLDGAVAGLLAGLEAGTG